MRYIYIGTAASDEDIEEVFSKFTDDKIVYVQQKWDYRFCQALEEASDNNLICISYPAIPVIASSGNYIFRKRRISNLRYGIYIPAINVPVLKQIASIFFVLRELLNIKENGEIKIITHTLYLQSIVACRIFKWIHKDVTVVSMIPDLPQYTSNEKISSSPMLKLLYDIYIKISEKVKGCVDGYVCFSKHQMEKLDRSKPFIVMEGFSDGSTHEEMKRVLPKDKKILFYAGNLKSNSGVWDFAKAFLKAELKDTEFWICGNGEQREKIEKLNSEKIKVLGVLSREEVYYIEKNSYLLINPRPITEMFSRYAFPSKLIEYMSSGTPVLTSHLPCIPQEYDDYLYYLEDNNIDSMAEFLRKLQVDNLLGHKAKEFVVNEKNPIVQGLRVLDFINSIK